MKGAGRGKDSKLFSKQVDVGVLIDRKDSVWHVGQRSRFLYKEMTQVARENGIRFFFFLARDVNWEKRQVSGFLYAKGQWRRRLFPLPPVVYSRIIERSWENRAVNQAFLQKVQEDPAIFLFNSRFLNKEEVAQALAQYPDMQPYLPRTELGTQENLRMLLQACTGVFIKPVDGCKGQGMLVLHKVGERLWKVQKAAFPLESRTVEGLEEVMEVLGAWRTDLGQCVLQEEVPRATYLGRSFDIRALAQKDGQGNWVYVGAAARVAAPGRDITHVVHGGRRVSVSKVLAGDGALKRQEKRIREDLRWLCEVVPRCLEKQIPLHWGLLAFDVTLTPEGKLFLLEVNSRPGSYSEDAIRRRSLRYLMAYCRYVAERGQSL